MDIEALATLLHETEQRHGQFESIAPPHDWWDWYAAYMHAREEGRPADESATLAERYMSEVKHIDARV